VSYKNSGKLPTALRQAHLVKIVKEDRVVLEFDTAGLSAVKPSFRIIEDKKPSERKPSGSSYSVEERPVIEKFATKNTSFTQGGSLTTAVFNIRLYDNAEISGKASVISTRGGILKDREFVIR
jgi:hypothetical protein